jgi:MFS family permease
VVRCDERYAWVIVGVCAAMVGMAFGALVNMAVFLTPLAADFGWARADLSLAYSVATIGTGVGGVVLGHFSDRIPVRRIAICGAFVTGLAFLFLSRLSGKQDLYVYHAVLGLFGVGAILAPLNSLASSWLKHSPGLAIGIVSAGGALGQGLMPLLSRQLILTEGWRQAYLTLGIVYLLVMVPLALLVRNPLPARTAGGTALGDKNQNGYLLSPTALLALLSIAVIFCCICMATPIMHVAALGSDLGLGGRDAAGLLAVMMIFGMAGRVAFGGIADRFGNLQSYMVASLGQTALAFLFPYADARIHLYVLSAVFGLFFSGAMTGLILCAREYSPPGKTGLSIGVVMFVGWLGMAFGAWQGGMFYDLCGDYFSSFANASLGGMVNLLILGLLYLYTVHQPGLRTKAAV